MGDLEKLKMDILGELISVITIKEIQPLKILTKEDLLDLFPWKESKLNLLIKANVLPLTKVGKDYITTEKQIQEWLLSYEGKEIFYD